MMRDFNSQHLTSQKGRQQIYAHYEKIIKAILNRDEKTTRDAMLPHLENVMQTMKKASPRNANNPVGASS